MVNLAQYKIDDDFSHHQREFDNAFMIFNQYLDLKDAVILDLCSGTGLHTGFLMEKKPSYIYGVDILDYSTLWGGNFKEKNIEFFRSHGITIPGDKCQYITANAENLFFKTNFFDFVYCINAFEHIQDPSEAIVEIWRVLRPGGYAFIQFDPLFYCDTGSHMFDFLPEPWLHLMISEEDYIQKLCNAKCPQSIIDDYKFGLNKKPRSYFFALFTAVCSEELSLFSKIVSYDWSAVTKDSHLNHPNYFALLKSYTHEDLTFRGMNILLRKRE